MVDVNTNPINKKKIFPSQATAILKSVPEIEAYRRIV